MRYKILYNIIHTMSCSSKFHIFHSFDYRGGGNIILDYYAIVLLIWPHTMGTAILIKL